VLLELGYQAMVVWTLGIPVEKMVKLRGGGERGRDQPQQQHQRDGSELATSTPTF
jgi:hypothetical protein